ncbi:MAG: Smr/MutS family protein [Eubacteriales bacterium]|nr:Smr/MutS family protein [Eubacteriales bacterium]
MDIAPGILVIDVHDHNLHQCRVALDAALRRASAGVYALRVVHGYSRGSTLRDMVRNEYAAHPKVRRIEQTQNPGETLLVLREL